VLAFRPAETADVTHVVKREDKRTDQLTMNTAPHKLHTEYIVRIAFHSTTGHTCTFRHALLQQKCAFQHALLQTTTLTFENGACL